MRVSQRGFAAFSLNARLLQPGQRVPHDPIMLIAPWAGSRRIACKKAGRAVTAHSPSMYSSATTGRRPVGSSGARHVRHSKSVRGMPQLTHSCRGLRYLKSSSEAASASGCGVPKGFIGGMWPALLQGEAAEGFSLSLFFSLSLSLSLSLSFSLFSGIRLTRERAERQRERWYPSVSRRPF